MSFHFIYSKHLQASAVCPTAQAFLTTQKKNTAIKLRQYNVQKSLKKVHCDEKILIQRDSLYFW